MPSTTNFNWTTPADTDLVKDGAAAIRTLGNGIDTSFVDLKGGTTGQVLSKASNTDLDFSWIAAGAGADWSLLNTGGTALTGAQTVTVSGISGKDKFLIILDAASMTTATADISIRINGDTASNYYQYGISYLGGAAGDQTAVNLQTTSIILGTLANASASITGYCFITGGDKTGVKAFHGLGSGNQAGYGSGITSKTIGGYYNSSSTISSISIYSSNSNLDAGTVYVYASA